MEKEIRSSNHELQQSELRILKLDDIIQSLYEDNIDGKVSDERFKKMVASYEDEQEMLKSRIAELHSYISNEKDKKLNINHFLSLVQKYTDIQALTPEIIREFIEKVYVYKAETVNGKRTQKIKILWNCIGEFSFPDATINGKTA